jgi:hypothetical protein
MRNFIISVLFLMAIAMNCQALNTVNISQESGMSILANFSDNASNQSALQNISLQNETNQTNQSSDVRKDSGDLWSWGKIPIGYEVNKNGSLVKLADQQWNPSI